MGRALQEQVAKQLLGPTRDLRVAFETLKVQPPATPAQYQALLHVVNAQKNVICDLLEVVADLAGRL